MDRQSGATEPLCSIPPYMLPKINTPTPPRSPAAPASPLEPKITENLSSTATPPVSPPRPKSADGIMENGGADSDKENREEALRVEPSPEPDNQLDDDNISKAKDNLEEDPVPPQEQQQQEGDVDQGDDGQGLPDELGTEFEGKQKKSKKKKSKKKSSRHDSDDEREGKESKKRSNRRHSHRSQDGKSSDERVPEREMIHDARNSSKDGDMIGEGDDLWAISGQQTDIQRSRSKTRSRSRSKSIEKETDTSGGLYDNIVPSFNPLVPPPGGFIQSPPKDPFYPVPPATYTTTGTLY